MNSIRVRGAREHNLKNIDVDIPRGKLVVVTGISGSGKSSLAFDTLYAEGQRRYVESLSAYARQFLERMEKPDVDSVEGLSPAIAIEERSAARNPRSTVGTVTEIHDYLRLLFARVGTPHCFRCGKPIRAQSVEQVVDQLLGLPEGTRVHLLAPVVRGRKGEFRKQLEQLRRAGFVRARIDGHLVELDEEISLPRQTPHWIEVVVDRLVLREGIRRRLADSLEVAFRYGNELAKVEVVGADGSTEREMLFSRRLACPDCGVSFPELSPRIFSFNNPHGACPSCSGLGVSREIDPERVVADPDRPLLGGAIRPWESKRTGGSTKEMVVRALARRFRFSPELPFRELPEEVRHAVLYGTGGVELTFVFARGGKRHEVRRPYEGVVPYLERLYRESAKEWVRAEIETYMTEKPCSACSGSRLRPEALSVRIAGKTIAEVGAFSVAEARRWFAEVAWPPRQRLVAEPIVREIEARLGFLEDVGLDYLTLDRPAATLSGGEGRRIQLATQVGAKLSGVLYVLDEPSIGLHPRDNRRLLRTLGELRDLGNTVVVVEHDRDTILAADYVLELGPGAGIHGGHLVAAGSPDELSRNPRSLTGAYLSGSRAISVPRTRRRGSGWTLRLLGARHHNLRGIDVSIPLGTFTCVTGVSGSGKSSLVIDTLYRALAQRLHGAREQPGEHDALEGWQLVDKVVDVDQTPIGRTPRSNAATYSGLFTLLRELYAQLPESRLRGYGPGRFSFNVPDGRCEACRGDGVLRVEMHFLPDVYVPCEVCGGRRYNRETLEVTFKGRSIADVLDMTVGEAWEFLSQIPRARQKLESLRAVGLDYLKLGQPGTTLSGGEAQRLKLARELARKATGRTLYILDEPTTGLHFEDIRRLLEVLHRLVDAGNTVLVIEHNMEVVKTADHVIDLGPEGGERGGRIVAEGTPEEIAASPASHTGRALAPLLLDRAA
ncbi:MAG: UvrABC system protein A [Candidatus Binatia bacterium]|nr:MAG: UvrABC system protein A [Candidatus Binatia bacterium]